MIKLVFCMFILTVFNLFAQEDKAEKTSKPPRPADVPEIVLFPDYRTSIYFDADNKFQVNSEDYKRLYAIAEYLIQNPERSVHFRIWQHENEEPEIREKRKQELIDRLTEIGVMKNRILFKLERPIIPQDTSDVFTPEELIKARRADLRLIR